MAGKKSAGNGNGSISRRGTVTRRARIYDPYVDTFGETTDAARFNCGAPEAAILGETSRKIEANEKLSSRSDLRVSRLGRAKPRSLVNAVFRFAIYRFFHSPRDDTSALRFRLI